VQSPTDFYFQRFGFCERQILTPPLPDLGIVVVIPCFNEPDLLGSLVSIWECARPDCAVEVIVILNSPANSPLRSQNEMSLNEALAWATAHSEPRFQFHVLPFFELSPKNAGVGLARKIGMDEALRRFDGNARGVIACFDADCRCERNYLTSIEQHFWKHPYTPGCSIYFEHPLTSEAIVAYELHLRYYVQALRYSGFPYAHHTIGSSMAVRADAYREQGGMNKRKAGEDFYFLQKIIPLGGFTDLMETTVYPSPRASNRVPFGTGRAVQDYERQSQLRTYPLEAFQDLRRFFDSLPELSRTGNSPPKEGQSEPMRAFLKRHGFEQALDEIQANTSSETTFRKRFFHWFNGFRVMKFIHHARDDFYGDRDVVTAAKKLLALKPRPAAASCSHDACVPAGPGVAADVLKAYRRLDREPKVSSLEGCQPLLFRSPECPAFFGIEED